MKVVYSVVSNPHPHTLVGHLARTWSGSFFWDKDKQNPTGFAVLATKCDGTMVGIQKFDVDVRGRARILDSNATYVWPMYRGINIAQHMWTVAIREQRITKVRVRVVSDRGKTLVETLSDEFPDIKFEMVEAGNRALRSLKGSKGSKGSRRKAA